MYIFARKKFYEMLKMQNNITEAKNFSHKDILKIYSIPLRVLYDTTRFITEVINLSHWTYSFPWRVLYDTTRLITVTKELKPLDIQYPFKDRVRHSQVYYWSKELKPLDI